MKDLKIIERNLDFEKLINEIEVRPALWAMTINSYSDRSDGKKCCNEIIQVFGPVLSLENKEKLGKYILIMRYNTST